MITFKQDTELEVVISFDEKHDQIAEQSVDTFKAGEFVDAEIVGTEILPDGTTSQFVDIQYGDGSMSLGVQRDSFEVL